MKNIIQPVDRLEIEKELTPEKLIRKTNNGNNLIYITTFHESPNIMREIGRLREISFRDAGGGTGKDTDIDDFDTNSNCFKQLFVWNPIDKEIIGGYRFKLLSELYENERGKISSPTMDLFDYSRNFKENYLPYTIELGRSFVQPNYQPTNNIRKGMYSLDNIWDGLGAILLMSPEMKFFFGKITMYPKSNKITRDYILFFMKKFFNDNENLVWAYNPIKLNIDIETLNNTFIYNEYEKDYKILIQKVRSLGETVPPLVNAYMNLSSTLLYFGTSINHEFGEVEESSILLTIADIYTNKIERHLKIKD